MPPRLSVVVPAYNEEARIGRTLERISAFAAGVAGGVEILLVDDGSRDGTVAVANGLGLPGLQLIRLERNLGKGGALRTGVVASTGAEVLICDADLSTPIEEYARLQPFLDEADLVLGSRGVVDSKITERQPWHREAMGRVFNLLVRWLVVDGFRDTQCGFKLMRGDVARALFPDLFIERFAFDVELVWLALRRGYRVREVGVVWHNSPQSRVDPLRDSTRMLLDILRIRWRHRNEPRVAAVARAAKAGA
jgi:dolichyl-phosphate beta-glucosyltransferase